MNPFPTVPLPSIVVLIAVSKEEIDRRRTIRVVEGRGRLGGGRYEMWVGFLGF